jgi:hypothetical protein
MRKLITMLALAGILLLNAGADSSCAPDEEPTNTETTAQAVSTEPPYAPDAPPGLEARWVDGVPQIIPIEPLDPAQVPAPGPGERILFVDIGTLDVADLPTIRRVGVKIFGVSDDGTPVLANGQPWYINEIASTPKPYELLIGEGVVTAVVTVSFFGKIGEAVMITAYAPGASEGLGATGTVEALIEGQRQGIVILNLPIALG